MFRFLYKNALLLALVFQLSAEKIYVTLPLSKQSNDNFLFTQARLAEAIKGKYGERASSDNYIEITQRAKSGIGILEPNLGELYATNAPFHVTLLGPIELQGQDINQFADIVTRSAKNIPPIVIGLGHPTTAYGNHLGIQILESNHGLSRLVGNIATNIRIDGSPTLKTAYETMPYKFNPKEMHISLARFRPRIPAGPGQPKRMIPEYNFENKSLSPDQTKQIKRNYMRHLDKSETFRLLTQILSRAIRHGLYEIDDIELNNVEVSMMSGPGVFTNLKKIRLQEGCASPRSRGGAAMPTAQVQTDLELAALLQAQEGAAMSARAAQEQRDLELAEQLQAQFDREMGLGGGGAAAY